MKFIYRIPFLVFFILLYINVFSQKLLPAPDSLTVKNSLDSALISIIGVGDIMMGTNYPNLTRLPPNEGKFLLHSVEPFLRDATITFGNLEGVLLDKGGNPKSCKDPSVCYVFRSPVQYTQNLLDAGFDVVSLANNHAGDFGDEGRKSSMRSLDSAGILHAGQLKQPYILWERQGIKYGLAAFSPNSGCVNLNDLAYAKALITHLDSLCDVVMVSFHGGAEGATFQHVTREKEIFHGENRGNVYQFAHTLIDHGADIIFGHGPHVTRAIEIYKDRFIAYSLGNFCTYLGISISGPNGLAPIIKIWTNKEGAFVKGNILSTFQSREKGVQIDPQNRVLKIIQDLTKKDFPECPLEIDQNGNIIYIAP